MIVENIITTRKAAICIFPVALLLRLIVLLITFPGNEHVTYFV